MLVYLTSFTVFSGDIKKKSEKKKALKMTSLLVYWSFSELFYLFFSSP